ncbi:DNA-binding response regulator, NarL/FixJ family, contains REC and HTH domains [Duganella sacchari]|uniref:DNA-binding response regulator, NarL/FixJ family, contains REC and HTH domains n=1 Tax=Duganella sacchari TaxID=551987 RepID=A0A1M7R5I9_9BURK|nr:response regulator transcription factor [Duganella sacchari]SHN40546.1 DNA-binding response regulator, NarL/FixJ family, contains REC and HTH domains [Duganella sacchari]
MTGDRVELDESEKVEVSPSASAFALLVDEHPIVRLGLMTLLRQIDSQFKFIEADTSKLAIDLTLMHSPSIAVIDLSLAGGSSFELIKKLRLANPSMPILVVSHHDERLYAERAVRAGARGYAMKTIPAKLMCKAVQSVRDGKVWLSESLRDELVNRIAATDGATVNDQFRSLSDREMSVFHLIGMGLKKGGIARELNLSPHTVESYRTNIKQKMGIASGAELYRLAFLHSQNGVIVRPDEH